MNAILPPDGSRPVSGAAPIVTLDVGELDPGRLAACFLAGAAAVLLVGDPDIAFLWRHLVAESGERLPWEASMLEMARNLMADDDVTQALGDICYVRPGRHSYMARKIELWRDGRGRLVASPAVFREGEASASALAPETAATCWRLAERIMRSLAPRGHPFNGAATGYRVAVQRLKYVDRADDLAALLRMSRNSLGPWARIGQTLDRRRETLHGPLGRRGVCDLLALVAAIAPFGRLIDWIDALVARRDRHAAGREGYELIVKPHLDTRYFSALCGTRENIRTEIFVDGRWEGLPIGCDSLVLLPGRLATEAFGIRPTLHRVLHTDAGQPLGNAARIRNTTLLLGMKRA
jgi:hypothetical protein